MRKILPELLQSVEFIRLSSLPFYQMIKLREWLSEEEIINIPHSDGLIRNCVKYESYEFWFDVVHSDNQFEELSLF